MIWPLLPPRLRYLWLARERAWFYLGLAFWLGSAAFLGWGMARGFQ